MGERIMMENVESANRQMGKTSSGRMQHKGTHRVSKSKNRENVEWQKAWVLVPNDIVNLFVWVVLRHPNDIANLFGGGLSETFG